MQNVVPKFAFNPGKVWRTGPSLGQDNEHVYRGYLGLSDEEFRALTEAGTI
jgi:formyl-CoA transferase